MLFLFRFRRLNKNFHFLLIVDWAGRLPVLLSHSDSESAFATAIAALTITADGTLGRPYRFQKSHSASRLYHKSLVANANLALRLSAHAIPDHDEVDGSPPTSPERFLTPNETMSVSANASAFDYDRGDYFYRPTPAQVKSASHVSHRGVFNYSPEEVEMWEQQRYLPRTPSSQNSQMKRMKSLGNLPLFQRDFGGTPQEMVRMRKDFEAHRFGMARMRSMTDLMEISSESMAKNSNRASDEFPRVQRNVARDSIFKRNPTLDNGQKRAQMMGIGDTKFIGGGELEMNHKGNHRRLSKNKSMGQIPDLISERARYDALVGAQRNHQIDGLDENGGDGDEDHDDDCNVGDWSMTSYEQFNVLLRNRRGYQVSEPGTSRSPEEMLLSKTPFERGYRRSYMRHQGAQSPQSPQMFIRQSDGGWFTPSGGAGGASERSSVASNGNQFPWTQKLYRYQREESVEECLIQPVSESGDRGGLVVGSTNTSSLVVVTATSAANANATAKERSFRISGSSLDARLFANNDNANQILMKWKKEKACANECKGTSDKSSARGSCSCSSGLGSAGSSRVVVLNEERDRQPEKSTGLPSQMLPPSSRRVSYAGAELEPPRRTMLRATMTGTMTTTMRTTARGGAGLGGGRRLLSGRYCCG